MARVYLAVHRGGRELCVVKQLLDGSERVEPLVRRFERETTLARRLIHPNIPRVREAGWDGERPFISFEYVAGQTLQAVLEAARARGERLPAAVGAHVVRELLRALVYAHELTGDRGQPLDLVHRDLSPRNVLVGYDGAIKLIDFGVARADVDDFRTATGVLVGTLAYLSPEQTSGSRVDQRSDVYAACALAFEVFSGRSLVPLSSPLQMIAQIRALDPPVLRAEVPGFPAPLDLLLRRGLARDPEARPRTARALADALEDAAAPLGRADRAALASLMGTLFPGAEAAMARKIEEARAEWTQVAELEPTWVAPRALDPAATADDGGEASTATWRAGASAPRAEPEPLADTPPAHLLAASEERTPVVPSGLRPLPPSSKLAIGASLVALTLTVALISERVSSSVRERSAPPSLAAVPLEPPPGPKPIRSGEMAPEITPAVRARVEGAADHAITPPTGGASADRAGTTGAPADHASAGGIAGGAPKKQRSPRRPEGGDRTRALAPEPSRDPTEPTRPEHRRPGHAPTDDRWAALERELARLREDPADGPRFEALVAELKRAAEPLGAEERRRVVAAADAAARSGDVDKLALGLERLITYGRASKAD